MEEVKRKNEEFYSNGKIKREVSYKTLDLGSSYFHDGKLLMRGELITGLQDDRGEGFF